MIAIDFQGGSHGNFLEFVCNVASNVDAVGHPFNTRGASHRKHYLSPKVFYSDHYSFVPVPLVHDWVVAVKIKVDDLLPLSQVSLLRAGDYGYDNDLLENNTYNKLNIVDYKSFLDTLINGFFANQIENSYNQVKDPEWPQIRSLADFQNLPEHIRRECADVHNLELLELTKDNPDCPRHILREFFQIGFTDPINHGFIKRQQQLMKYPDNTRIYEFPFDAFYDTQKFLNQIELTMDWAKIKYVNQDRVLELHKAFLEKQPYKDSKIKCDLVAKQLMCDSSLAPPKLNLIEEAYVNSMLEKHGYECRY